MRVGEVMGDRCGVTGDLGASPRHLSPVTYGRRALIALIA